MISILTTFMDSNPRCGVCGPSMYYFDSQKKYADYQTINFFTGHTRFRIAHPKEEAIRSDGVSNVFMVRKSTFLEQSGFDPLLIQTFTEPDFSFHAAINGWSCTAVPAAITYHKISSDDMLTPRTMGGTFNQKAYCTMRNRHILIARYGTLAQKIIYTVCFSWAWPLLYSLIVIRYKRFDLPKFYVRGWFDGIIFALSGKIANSLPRLMS